MPWDRSRKGGKTIRQIAVKAAPIPASNQFPHGAVRRILVVSVEASEFGLFAGPGRAKPGAQACICLVEQSPAPHIHRPWATALGRNERRCCLVEVVSGHSDPRIARYPGPEFQESGPELAQRRVSRFPISDPDDCLANQTQQLVNRDPEGELGLVDGGRNHLVQGCGCLQVAAG